MADFKQALAITLKINEGGYVNDPLDSGGETYKGISRKNFPHWAGWIIIDGYKSSKYFPKILDGDQKLQGLIDEFYKTVFWDAIRGDEINSQQEAYQFFDEAVNIGDKPDIMLIQRTLNVPETGHMDDTTLNAINS